MKTISKLKSVISKKIENPTPVVKKVLKTPSSIRDKSKKDDSALKIQKQLKVQSTALQGAISKDTRKLIQIRDEILEKTEKSIKAGDGVIGAAKKRAKSILGDAKKTKSKTATILAGAEKLEKDLEIKEKDLEKLSREVELARIDVSIESVGSAEKNKKADYNLEISGDKLKEVEALHETIAALHGISVDVITSLLDIYIKGHDTASQNQAKTDKMYSQILDMEKIVRIDTAFNKKRTGELGKKETRIKDQMSMLKRIKREIKEDTQNGK